MSISLSDVKKLREMTSAPITSCKEALEEAAGDFKKAREIIKKKGQDVVLKKSSRDSKEGIVGSYIHANGKIGVLVKVYCETDFVARNEDFKKFVHEVALQIAAVDPKFVSPQDISEEALSAEKEEIMVKMRKENKPPEIMEKIVAGKIEKMKNELSLLTQPLVRDPETNLSGSLAEITAKLGEKIEIGEFIRFEIE